MTQAISPKGSPPNLVSRSGIPLETLEWEQIQFIPVPDAVELPEAFGWSQWDLWSEPTDEVRA